MTSLSAHRAPAPHRPPALPPSTLLVGGGLLLGGVLVGSLLVGGGAPAAPLPGLADPGLVTGWGAPVVDLLVRLLAVLTVGQLGYAALLAPAFSTSTVRALRASSWSAAGWLVSEVAALLLTASSVYGVPVTRLSVPQVAALVGRLPAGHAALWVVGLLAVVIAGTAVLARRPEGGTAGTLRPRASVLLLVALGAVVVPVLLAGHSAAAADHAPAVVALSVHVVTASLWVGGLAALLLHGRGRDDSATAVRRFSTLALGCVALLLLSAAVSVLLVAGRPSWSWTGEGWVHLLTAKTVLVVLLASIGWWHRRRTLPALVSGRPRAFLRLAVVEVALMAVTLALSVALASSPPPPPPTVVGSTGSPVPPDQAAPLTGPSAGAPAEAPVEDMSGHDHGELSVTVLVDGDRFHVQGAVRPGQPVTVFNSSSSPATVTAVDGGFEVDVPVRAIVTFPAPAAPGSYAFVNLSDGEPVDGFVDTLRVSAP